MASLNNDWMHLKDQLDYYLTLRVNYEDSFRTIIIEGIKKNEIKLLKEALVKKYEAEIADAEARLYVYFTNPVGIGEHPQHTEEMDNLVGQLTDAVVYVRA